MSYINLQLLIGNIKKCMFCQIKQKYKNQDVKVATNKNVIVILFASPFIFLNCKVQKLVI